MGYPIAAQAAERLANERIDLVCFGKKHDSESPGVEKTSKLQSFSTLFYRAVGGWMCDLERPWLPSYGAMGGTIESKKKVPSNSDVAALPSCSSALLMLALLDPGGVLHVVRPRVGAMKSH